MLFLGKRFLGLSGGAKGWLIGEALRTHPRIALIVKDTRAAEELAADIRFFRPHTETFILPSWEVLPFEDVSPEVRTCAERLAILLSLPLKKSFVLIVTPESVLQRLLPKNLYEPLSWSLKIQESCSKEDLVRKLVEAGFTQTSLAEDVGEFSVRSSVIDIFFSPFQNPARVRLTDDYISTLELFDQESQRSIAPVNTIQIYPVRESLPLYRGGRYHDLLASALQNLKSRGKALETPPQEIARAVSALRTASRVPGQELFQIIGIGTSQNIHAFIPPTTVWAVVDDVSSEQALYQVSEQAVSRNERMSSEHRLVPETALLFDDADTAWKEMEGKPLFHIEGIHVLEDPESDSSVKLGISALPPLKTKLTAARGTGEGFAPLRNLIDEYRNKGRGICFVVGSKHRAERLQRILLDIEIQAPILDFSASEWLDMPYRSPVVITLGFLSRGFDLPQGEALFVSEQELFLERTTKKQSQKTFNLKRLLSSLAQLSEGDYVVHQDYGIGLYRGLVHLAVEGTVGDFLFLEYADSTLYLPVHNIGRVQKHVGGEGLTPALDKLASTRWTRTKAKVRESVVHLAGDLIRLYSARSVAAGWRFEPHGAEDERFSDDFPHTETPDQLKAIHDTLADMAADRIMDRLICGDVGFGKTEVAIRAAFKCFQHRRQTVVLCPTTILVEQHKRNFLSRFDGYDIRIESMSRFNTPAQNRTILEGLADGRVDIVIGTHRLLSRDVQFHDLGLLIIDEEHRFGVKQKERLKAIKKNVDVLTLTATPIPRTLHLSLLGIRDISVISTPPTDRRTIRTFIANHDEAIIRDAIIREIQRGGQVFYLHNRIDSIDAVTGALQQLVPEAQFRAAHGQMTEAKLEAIMTDFIGGAFQVLVSTTIIESGIDIPNANTIIIERADTYGLAQLYQLRGRVGRSTRQAYAYLMVPKARTLTADAQKRLKALQALDDLGLGFNLALRDMEIRGAGNLLGKEQSGNVLAVGFDLYTKILNEAVLHLKGEDIDISDSIEPEMKLPFSAFIPEWYLPDVSERLILYQRYASIASDGEAEELREETADRFGPLPREVDTLVTMMRIRSLLRRFGCVRAEVRENRLNLSFHRSAPLDLNAVLRFCNEPKNKVVFSRNLTLSIGLETAPLSDIYHLLALISSLLDTVGASHLHSGNPHQGSS